MLLLLRALWGNKMWSYCLSTLFACKNIKRKRWKNVAFVAFNKKASPSWNKLNVWEVKQKMLQLFHIVNCMLLFPPFRDENVYLLCNYLMDVVICPRVLLSCPDFYYTHLGQYDVRVIHYIQEIRQPTGLPTIIRNMYPLFNS